ncbi:superoxide dismutase [Spartobacteria bacterium LR76]|nr:superoxide dismutase [Spartobacteria bacterium LR76]
MKSTINSTPIPLDRRSLFKLSAGSLLATWLATPLGNIFAQTSSSPSPAPAPTGPYTLPPLPYAYDALNPSIDTETMRIHHDKHHKAYVDNANKLLADQPELAKLTPEELLEDLDKAPESIRTGLRNNVGGHVNHSLFWQMMSPKGGGEPKGELAEAINKQFGSFSEFQKKFNEAAMKRFGSGWAWLVLDDGKLEITSTANQDSPIMDDEEPILGLDVWEHAYYLKYQNRRPEYVTAWWNVVDWDFANSLYKKALKKD